MARISLFFHAYDSFDSAASKASAIFDFNDTMAQKDRLEPLAQRAMNIGVHCKIVLRRGSAGEQILASLREWKTDRIVMGTHSPGPVGRLLVCSVPRTCSALPT